MRMLGHYAVGEGGGGGLQQRDGWLLKDIEVISCAGIFFTLPDFDFRRGMREIESRENARGGGGDFKWFRGHILFIYTPAVRSKIWSKLIFGRLGVILRFRVLITYVGA